MAVSHMEKIEIPRSFFVVQKLAGRERQSTLNRVTGNTFWILSYEQWRSNVEIII